MCPRSCNHGLTQPSWNRPTPVVVLEYPCSRNWWNYLGWATAAQALCLQPIFTAGLGNFASLSLNERHFRNQHCCWQASQYCRLQNHCCPCEPILGNSVATSQELQPPLQWTYPHPTVTLLQWQTPAFWIPLPFALYGHTDLIQCYEQWWRDQCQGDPHVPWHSHISVGFMDSVTMSTVLACTLEHEFPMGDKYDEENFKSLTRKTSIICTALLKAPCFVNRSHFYWSSGVLSWKHCVEMMLSYRKHITCWASS